MFMSKDKLIKIAMGVMITSLLNFSVSLPVNADDLQSKKDSNTSIALQEEVQEGSLGSKHPDPVIAKETSTPTDKEETVTDAVYGPGDDDEEKVKIGVYKRLVNSYEKLLNIYEKLLDLFGTIPAN